MDMKFRDVLAGRAGRPWKPQHHRIVDRLPLGDPASSARVAIRGGGILPASEVSVLAASGPDTRTTAMALGARPDESAKMVCSRGCIAYLPPSIQTGKAIPDRGQQNQSVVVHRTMPQHFAAAWTATKCMRRPAAGGIIVRPGSLYLVRHCNDAGPAGGHRWIGRPIVQRTNTAAFLQHLLQLRPP